MSISSMFKKYNIGRDFVMFCMVVFALCYLFTDNVFKKKSATLKLKEEAVVNLSVDVAELNKAGGDLLEKETALLTLETKHEKLKQEQKRLFSKFPNRAQASRMLKDVISEEKFSKINLEAFHPQDERPSAEGYTYVPIELKVSGDFNNVGEYLKYIEDLPRVLVIDDISFKSPTEENVFGSCVAELRGKTFVLNY